jgi:hypothetical protein
LPQLKAVLPNARLRRGFGREADLVIDDYVDRSELPRDEGPFGDRT